ncbi:MAG TPA: hypothetical protein VJ249_08055 [Candidatus Bathyarchaeia archaeon]|nr:hypothetical protein [Candidatus Bathyarchaeia archaeon]
MKTIEFWPKPAHPFEPRPFWPEPSPSPTPEPTPPSLQVEAVH